MATKTITLEIDAYEHLKRAKRNEKESFSSVVRRAEFPAPAGTGMAILESLRRSTVPLPGNDILGALKEAQEADYANPRMSPSAWGKRE